MSQAFQLHQTLSTNARAQTAHAISLEENRQTPQALAAYARATDVLASYTRAFSPGSPAYAKLAPHERPSVSRTHATLTKHLASVTERRRVLHTAVTAPNATFNATSTATATATRAATRASNPVIAPASKLNRDDPLVKAIEAEILDSSTSVQWDDIYGLDEAKRALHEMVVLPALRPDLYRGLRAPGRGILLFGPPGTGKTLIAKAVATNVKATFFSISASSLNSKFHGESERLVRMLFAVARERQPSFVFIDEVDSILGSRSDNEHEASRRLKTEFMAQFDGAIGGAEDRVYVMAASNRPQDLDDAVRRRLDRRIYVPLPDAEGRKDFFRKLTSKSDDVMWKLSGTDFESLSKRTVNFSGSDIKALCREASLMPLRELGARVSQVQICDVRPCDIRDFDKALHIVRPSSNRAQITELEKWNLQFGSNSKCTEGAGSTSGLSRSATGPVKRVQTRTSTTKALVPVRQQGLRQAKHATSSKSDMWASFFVGGKAKR